jgi:UDP-glucose 4-epimerase
LVDNLVELGRSVTVLDNFSTGSRDNLIDASKKGDVNIIEGSILDLDAIDAAMQDCEIVFHLAVECVRRSLERPLENHEVNATGTLNVLEIARRRKIKRFMYCSSSEVYGNGKDELLNEQTTLCEPTTVYGASKLVGEYYSKAYYRTYGLPTVVVRPFNAYGPRSHDQGDLAEVIPRFVIRLLNGLSPVIFGNGKSARDFTYVTDVVKGLNCALNCDELIGREVNIAYGRVFSVEEVAKILAPLCGQPDIKPMFVESRPGDIYNLHADTSLASKTLGFKANISFEEGLQKYLNWFKETYPRPGLLVEDQLINWQMPVTG